MAPLQQRLGPLLRRCCAQLPELLLIASPLALSAVMYELNPLSVDATGDDFASRSTFESLHNCMIRLPDTFSRVRWRRCLHHSRQ